MPIEVMNLIMRATVDSGTTGSTAASSSPDPNVALGNCGSSNSSTGATPTHKSVARQFRRSMEINKER